MILQSNTQEPFINDVQKNATYLKNGIGHRRSKSKATSFTTKKGMLASLFFLLVFLVSTAQEKKVKEPVTGFIDFNVYYDTREYSVLTYNILANISNRLQFFSMTNYQSAKYSFDLESTYSEHNLRWSLGKNLPLDLTTQYALRDGPNNDDLRFGLRWKVSNTAKLASFFKKINLGYALNTMIVQFRRKENTKFMTQLEHAYRIGIAPKFFHNRLYLGGFADQNIQYLVGGGIAFDWVSEHQMGFRVVDQLYVVLEYRINDYLSNDNYGLGYGLEYKVIF